MQTAFSYLGIKEIRKQNKPKSKLKTTSRDLEIIYFILEMKFSNIQLIHQKFFSTTRFGLKSCSFDYTRQRLSELVKYGLIEKVDTFLKTGLYQTTQKGYFLLCNSNLQRPIPKPSFGVDIRTFDHDLKVSNIRVELEQCDKATSWISERSICEDEKYRSLFTNEFRPDAIYTCPNGAKVAFELELSRKSKDRYKQKLNRYIQVMTNPAEDSRIFAKVHYVFKDLKLLEYVKSETQLYQPLFNFSLESEFLSKTENI